MPFSSPYSVVRCSLPQSGETTSGYGSLTFKKPEALKAQLNSVIPVEDTEVRTKKSRTPHFYPQTGDPCPEPRHGLDMAQFHRTVRDHTPVASQSSRIDLMAT